MKDLDYQFDPDWGSITDCRCDPGLVTSRMPLTTEVPWFIEAIKIEADRKRARADIAATLNGQKVDN